MQRSPVATEPPGQTSLALRIRSAYAPSHVYRGIVDGCGAPATCLASAHRR
jgi:hypothetical protein